MSAEDSNDDEFLIPDPPSMEQETELDYSSLLRAFEEQRENRDGTLEQARRGRMDWNTKFWLKLVLFAIVISLNFWWDSRVADWVWYSGYKGGGFHLSDAVLIALVSTSTANFLALILIVAKHLYPSEDK